MESNDYDLDTDYFSDVPISRVVLAPAMETVSMDGFAWSHELGLIPEMGNLGTRTVAPRFKIIKWP